MTPAVRNVVVLGRRAAGVSAAASQFFARVATPAAARQTQYATLIDALVAAGVWTKLDALYVLAAADQATALTNLVQTAYGATAVNSPTFAADTGYTGASTKYLNTNFNPTTAVAPNFAQNSASIFAWGASVAAISGLMMGNSSSTVTRVFEISPRWADNVLYGTVTSDTEDAVAGSQADGSGLRVLSRTGAAGYSGYINGGGAISVTRASTAPANFTLTISQPSSPYTANIYSAGFGGGLTAQNVADLQSALHTYLQAVAGVA